MSFQSVLKFVGLFVLALCSETASAQLPNPYGAPIDGDAAKKVAAAALAETRNNGWNMAVAIVDPAGDLVYFEKLDGTQGGTSQQDGQCANADAATVK